LEGQHYNDQPTKQSNMPCSQLQCKKNKKQTVCKRTHFSKHTYTCVSYMDIKIRANMYGN
jgi:hypothetical protein